MSRIMNIRLEQAKSGDERYKKAVIYSIRSGRFSVRTGWIRLGSVSTVRGFFLLKNGEYATVYNAPGFVLNNFVWFYEEDRDDPAAIKILLEHEKDRIEDLKRQLESRHDNCAVLIKELGELGD